MTLAPFDRDQGYRKDAFGRNVLAQNIAQQLISATGSSGFVVGIEGEWGSGKSHLLQQVQSELEQAAVKPIIVKLNPWLISGAESVVCSFLTQLASAISANQYEQSQKGVEVGKELLGYMSAFTKLAQPASLLIDQSGFIAGLLGVGGRAIDTTKKSVGELDKLLKSVDLNEKRKKVIRKLEELHRPIVVIIDDLDRLPSNEIRVMFQAIKAVADFPNIIYLVAYDPVIVDKAFDTDDQDRPRFREKIIQVSYPLPHIHTWDRARFNEQLINEVIESCLGQNKSQINDELFRKGISIVTRLCIYPRDTIRLCNRLRLTLINIGRNINTVDLIVLDAIALRFPNLISAIRNYSQDFTSLIHSLEVEDASGMWNAFATSDAEEKKCPWAKHLPEDTRAKDIAMVACRFIFEEKVNNTSADRRVRDPHLLAFYNSLGTASGVPSPEAIADLLNDFNKLKDEVGSADFENSLVWMLNFPPQSELVDTKSTLLVLSNEASRLCTGDRNKWNVLKNLGEISSNLIGLIPEPNKQRELLLWLIAVAPLSMTLGPVIMAAKQHRLILAPSGKNSELDDNQMINDKIVVLEVIRAWRDKVHNVELNDKLTNEPLLHSILYRMSKLQGSSLSEVWSLVAKTCAKGDGIESFCSPFIDSDAGDFELSNYFDLIWDPKELISHIQDCHLSSRYQRLISSLQSTDAIERYRQNFERKDIKIDVMSDIPT
jgi:hypothetical protein